MTWYPAGHSVLTVLNSCVHKNACAFAKVVCDCLGPRPDTVRLIAYAISSEPGLSRVVTGPIGYRKGYVHRPLVACLSIKSVQGTLKRVEDEEAERFGVGAGRSKDRQIP